METSLLADHLECIPTLAQWFKTEWPDFYAGRTPSEIEHDFQREANRDSIPLRLVALDGGTLLGTIVVRECATQTLSEFTPALGGLYVAEAYRRRGIGSRLVRTGMKAARDLNFQTLYTATAVAGGLLERLGWERNGTIVHDGERLCLYRCRL